MNLQEVLLEELKYSESSNLDRSPTWAGNRHLPSISASYSINHNRVVYFSQLQEPDPQQILELYKSVWNESEVPLLYVCLPHEIRIYNCYAEPTNRPDELDSTERLLKHLTNLIDVESAIKSIRQELEIFDRIHLDTEAFWLSPESQKIRLENRADQKLLSTLLQVRDLYTNKFQLPLETAYILLGRSIFIQYLEDREILTQDMFLEFTDGRASSYQEALSNHGITYSLFQALSNRFKGNIFPVEEGESKVAQPMLDILSDFLNGSQFPNSETIQRSFWPFDFRYIPVAFISEIYDAFIGESRRQTGAYYTSLSLVDFILEETLPRDQIRSDTTLLDPACGSGVFLVRTFQRLVDAWVAEHQKNPTSLDLSQILSRSIFGVDINPSAARIAIFNLYIALLDFLTPEAIRDNSFHLPNLKDKNIFFMDFFADEFRNKIGGRKFDRIVGNPPWGKNTFTLDAAKFVGSRGYKDKIGGKQIVQAFLLYAPELCSEQGEVVLLAPAKSTIHVHSGTHQQFRNEFFSKYKTRLIINFSALRYELFEAALSPTVAIFYQPQQPTPKDHVTYCVPKPSPSFQQASIIVMDSTEIKLLEMEKLLKEPDLWKTTLWGTHRDVALISRLQSLTTLEEQAQTIGLKIGQGFQIGGPGKKSEAAWLQNILYLPTKKLTKYALNPDSFESVRAKSFYRASIEKREFFVGPIALIKEGVTDRKLIAAFQTTDIAYKHKIMGIVGKTEHKALLKWLVAYINSPLAQYYHFLTSTSWAVERDIVIQNEFKLMPFLLPSPVVLRDAEELFDKISNLVKSNAGLNTSDFEQKLAKYERPLFDLVYDLYELNDAERQLVQDTVENTIDFFYWSKRSTRKPREFVSVQYPDHEQLQGYAEAFIKSTGSLLKYQGLSLNATIYTNGAPLNVIEFEQTNLNEGGIVRQIDSSSELRSMLNKLDKILLRRQASIYVRRHVRIYDGSRFYIIRPSERRFWTRSQARVDADSTLNEWLNISSVQAEEMLD